MSTSKFATRSFNGSPRRYFLVDTQVLGAGETSKAKAPSHHIICLDRSGSMYSDMAAMKATVEKVLTLQEFADPNLRISIISTSSSGDVTVHCRREPITDVMAPNSRHLQALRSIQATCMTCLSQALVEAEKLVDDNDVTAISFHTDGYANDPSPSAEVRSLDNAVKSLKRHPNLFVNTIGHRSYCDYTLLGRIANELSGKCLQAQSIQQVYQALHDTTVLLAGAMSPAVEVSRGAASLVVFVSRTARICLGSEDNLTVRGLRPSDDKVAYRFTGVTEAEYNQSTAPIEGETRGSEGCDPIFAYARASLAMGRLNEAKYALVSTRHAAMLRGHAKALVNSEIAGFATALDEAVFRPEGYGYALTTGYGVHGPSVLQVIGALSRPGLEVDVKALRAGYKRTGVRRVPGVRKEDGSLDLPAYESKFEGDGRWASVSGFDRNRSNPTINMLVSQPQGIYARGSDTRIASVAGVDTSNLKAFNNYTIVGDGSLNVSELTFRTSDKRVHRDLKGLGLVAGDYAPGVPFTVNLADLPLVDYNASFEAPTQDQVHRLVRLTILGKILSGMVKGESPTLTGDQIAALKTHYLTPGLNFSPPTTTEYTDLTKALATGQVDVRVGYKIDIGYPALTSVTKLRSGNDGLARRFTATLSGAKVEKPTLDIIGMGGVKFEVKKLTAATKLDETDTMSYPLYEGLLGLGPTTALVTTLRDAGINDGDFLAVIASGSRDKVVEAVTDASKLVQTAIENIWGEFSPLAFYIGASGLVPDTLGAVSYDADGFSAKYPEAKLNKAEKEEGVFYVLPNGTVITVYMTSEYFSTN